VTETTPIFSEKSVLLVSGPIEAGPAAVYAQNLMEGLSAAGIAHPLLTSEAPGIGLLSAAETPNVQVADGLDWLDWRPFVFRKVLNWSQKQEPALIHGLAERSAAIPGKLAEELELPYVLTVHSFIETGAIRLTPRCKRIIALSETLREHLVNDIEVPRELVQVIAPGVPVAPPPAPPAPLLVDGKRKPVSRRGRKKDPAPLKPELRPARLVVAIGDFNHTSDYATFMEAVRRIADSEGEGCSFVLSGEGPQESNLRNFCRDLHIDKRVTFVHGHAEHQRLLSEADVFVQTARREGFPMRALQAMAQGVPVVAASNGAILSLLEDEKNGFVIPPANHEVLAQRVLQLLHDDDLRRTIGEAGRATAAARFSQRAMTVATVEMYREVLAS
jgi:glycosyltransferase involved in cell wall biosynthesis